MCVCVCVRTSDMVIYGQKVLEMAITEKTFQLWGSIICSTGRNLTFLIELGKQTPLLFDTLLKGIANTFGVSFLPA